MNWYVKVFDDTLTLQLFLRTQQTDNPAAGANALDAAAIVSMYFDAASGKHVLVYFA